MPGDDINVAMLEALFEEQEGCKFSYEVGPEKTYPVTARFDLPLISLPNRLAQDVAEDDGRIDEIKEMIRDLLAAVIEK